MRTALRISALSMYLVGSMLLMACESKTSSPDETEVRQVGQDLYSSGQPSEATLQRMADKGVTTVVNLRTVTEEGYMKQEASAVEELGMRYHHIPVDGAGELNLENAEKLAAVLRDAKGPVWVHCSTGNRSGSLIALVRYDQGELTDASVEAFLEDAGVTKDAAIGAVRKIVKGN